MRVIVTDRSNEVEEYTVNDFSELFTVLSDEMKIDAMCGGSCSCATCHIYIEDLGQNVVVEASETETEVLEGLLHVQSNSRLLCQLEHVKINENIAIRIATSE